MECTLEPVARRDVARIANVTEDQLVTWINRKVVRGSGDVTELVDAIAAAVLTSAGVRADYLRRYVKMLSDQLQFHLFDVCPTAITRMRLDARGKLVRANRFQGYSKDDFLPSDYHEPYRYAHVPSDTFIWFSAHKRAPLPDCGLGNKTIDLKRLANDAGSKLVGPLVTSVWYSDDGMQV